MMTLFYTTFILVLMMSTASCSQKSLQLKPVLNISQCGLTQKNIIYIDSINQLNEIFKPSFNNPIKAIKNNFDSTDLILISMGQRSTAGYSIVLNDDKVVINNKVLNIDATFIKPSFNNKVAQVITTPCAIYKISKQAIRNIKLLN